MDTNTRTELTTVISPEIVAKMEAAQTATSERCPICRVGRGRFCLDIEGIATYDGIHLARRLYTEADDLTRAAYGF